jgi:DNA-binding PadR family transcriptional regulator
VLVLDLAVLGLLKESPMSGYELKKQLTVKLGALWRVSFGSLYPCLKRLAAEGALEVEVSGRTSRKKHVYQLTDRGNRLFHQLLESTDLHDLEQDRFPLRLAFFRYMRPEARIDQLERRRGYLQERLADVRATLRAARDRMDAYTLELMDHGLDEREREIAWLDRLIAAERRSTEDERDRPPARSGPDEEAGRPARLATSQRDPRLPAQTG